MQSTENKFINSVNESIRLLLEQAYTSGIKSKAIKHTGKSHEYFGCFRFIR